MREKTRNISWLSISSSAFLPNKMLDKCNFTAHAWCEHTVTMFGINKKKLLGEKKKVVKRFWFLACPCSFLPALISFPDFSETEVEYLRKVRMLCGFCWKCSKLVTFAGCGTGAHSTRSATVTAWCYCSYSPSRQAAQDQSADSLLSSTGCPWSH